MAESIQALKVESKVGKEKKKKSRILTGKISGQLELYMIMLPFIIWYLLFAYKPMYGLIIAFKDYNLFRGISGSDWVGLANFKEFLGNPYFYTTLKNTFMLSIYGLVFEFPFAILLALMLNEVKNKYFKSFIQTASFIPYFVATVIAAGLVVNMFSPSTGVVNLILRNLGLGEKYFLSRPEYFRPIFTGMNTWKDTGFNAIVYMAALTGIDGNLYEAARIDGASRFQQLKHITLPCIMPTIVIMLILRIGKMLNVAFETVLLLYQPATYSSSDIISTYVYRTGMVTQDFGLASAIGLFNALVGFVLVYGANRLSKRFTESSLW